MNTRGFLCPGPGGREPVPLPKGLDGGRWGRTTVSPGLQGGQGLPVSLRQGWPVGRAPGRPRPLAG